MKLRGSIVMVYSSPSLSVALTIRDNAFVPMLLPAENVLELV
jgi:hypothetical protein